MGGAYASQVKVESGGKLQAKNEAPLLWQRSQRGVVFLLPHSSWSVLGQIFKQLQQRLWRAGVVPRSAGLVRGKPGELVIQRKI